MREFRLWMVVAVLALGVTACGESSGSGGAVNSNEALGAFMGAIALDLAQVMTDLEPPLQAIAVKQDSSTNCPGGGGATWTANQFGTGTLGLDDCVLRGITVNGTLSGFLEWESVEVNAQMAGPVSVSGGFSGELNLTQLILQASIPATDASTYWEVRATDANGKMLCAYSGGPGCGPTPPL